ncbi:carbon-nitrogen hydrolase family protein [Campylobacter sp. 19-13652]|uniref:carbon-nitrogen hydrolase family protein n=1 Tax=Campylobacter sp. 19-13652 TaxID=2840180 RepID=UPI001C76E893|nr:carbon-nitrogen hydrolase family protein [Campylobacter sp. 19-13652]BCX79785.1 carbon-nitrogen hydrolase [Campylobacter sp. 19-13652]
MSAQKLTKIAALQIGELSQSLSRLDYYMRICVSEGVSALVLGEYTMQPFFKSLIKMPKGEISALADKRKWDLSELCQKHGISLITSLIMPKNGALYKGVASFKADGAFKFSPQNVLISYPHWDEEKFFANSTQKLSLQTFKFNDLKVGVINAYEAHFDECWRFLAKKGVHLVIALSANTFASNARWEALLKAKALSYGVSVLRVARVGEYCDDDKSRWEFYGDSMLISPSAEVLWRLGSKEELGIASIDKNEILKQRSIWNFRAQARQRGWL